MDNGQEGKKPEKLAWSLGEAAESTGLSKAYFRKIIAAREIRATKAGRRVLILDSDLRAWLDRNRAQATA